MAREWWKKKETEDAVKIFEVFVAEELGVSWEKVVGALIAIMAQEKAKADAGHSTTIF